MTQSNDAPSSPTANAKQEWEERRKDKLNYRYPGVGGESYQDRSIASHAPKIQVQRFLHVSLFLVMFLPMPDVRQWESDLQAWGETSMCWNMPIQKALRSLGNLHAVLNIAAEDVVFRLTYLVLRLEQVMGNVLLLCDKAILKQFIHVLRLVQCLCRRAIYFCFCFW